MNTAGFLQLIRPPNVFTAFADSMAGLLVCWGAGVSVTDRDCAIMAASGCLYLSGIVLNDFFDRDVDARERPTRPIPAGMVTPHEAAALGVGLLGAGVAIAAWVGHAAGLVALALAACILLYDAGMKRTRLGPLLMGSCRGLDLAMGVAAGMGARVWPAIGVGGPIVLACYVAGLTYIARDEVDGNTTRRARTGLLFLGVLACAVPLLTLAIRPPLAAWLWVVAALALAWRNWAPVWTRHDGPSTGRAIGGGIILIPVIDAAVTAVGGCPFWALSVALLAIPAVVLKQLYSPT